MTVYTSTHAHNTHQAAAGTLAYHCDACGQLRPRYALNVATVDCLRPDGEPDCRMVYLCLDPRPCGERARRHRHGYWS